MSTSDPVSRLNRALEGRYRIERELGEGGMATVYLADDLRHERKVALKVLKPELAAVVGAERFLAEIKTTANLQHPHILPLFDSGEADQFLFYVMPYVEGESLRERLDREKQLSVKDALALTQKIAGALDYAHGNHVVHRDIKPGNVLLSQQGEPLVADFGIALAVAHAGGGRITETGLSLGTPHYMSPEQATGDRDVDPRSDVYSLGCVLYEMLAGQPPYTASTAQAILAKILTADAPSITSERRTVPPHVGAVLAQALEKLPADRFESAAAFGAALTNADFTYEARRRASVAAPERLAATPAPGQRRWSRVAVGVAAMAGLAVGGAFGGWFQSTDEPVSATRALLDLGDLVLSPSDRIMVSADGSRFAVTGSVDGVRSVYWRNASEESFRAVAGAENVLSASFSPDGEWMVYSTTPEEGLFRVSLSGGAPTPLVPSGSVRPRQVHWGDDGTILFGGPTGLHTVPEMGGEPRRVLDSSGGTTPFRHTSLLPGGRAVIGAHVTGGVLLLDLETDSLRELIAGAFEPRYVETGHILYVDASGGLWARPFDASSLEMTGDAVPIFNGLSFLGGRHARYSVSRNGTLVYGAGLAAAGGHRLVVVDLEGSATALDLPPRDINRVVWSPDGRSLAYSGIAEDDDASDIYSYNVALGTAARPLTFVGANRRPLFSPDGSRIVFSSSREGTDDYDLFVKTLDDDTPPEPIISLPGLQYPNQWPSESLILFTDGPSSDLWLADLSDPDSARAREYLRSDANLRDGKVSPDGSVAAYRSDESGTDEIYIRSFPEPGAQEQVSDGGGRSPFWSPDGDIVYYWQAAVGLRVSFIAAYIDHDPTPRVLRREILFTATYGSAIDASDLHPDGDRLIIPQEVSSSATVLDDAALEPERFIVVTNWFTELCERTGDC